MIADEQKFAASGDPSYSLLDRPSLLLQYSPGTWVIISLPRSSRLLNRIIKFHPHINIAVQHHTRLPRCIFHQHSTHLRPA